MRFGYSAAAFGALVIGTPAVAHHGWSTYDANSLIVIEAPVLEARYENPHGQLEVEDGGQRWHVVLAPPARLQRRGVSPEDIAAGTRVRVEGYPSRVNEGEMRAERITIDGRTVELR